MKVSLVATVRNEGGNIRGFLEGLLAQTRPADEVIITDGGSTDDTVEVIREFIQAGASIHLIPAPGANPARGRNLAIQQTTGEIIASTDAGSRAEPGWLEELTSPFKDPTVDVACGFSMADAHSRREESFGILILGDIRDVNMRTFSPSHRSIAFRKAVWEKVGGYPEEIICAEDSLFNQRAREQGAKFVFCPKALVHWRPPGTLRAASRKFFRYARDDGHVLLFGRVYALILVKVLLVIGLAVTGFYSSFFWLPLFLGFVLYYLRMIQVNRTRGSLATLSLVFTHRIILDVVRLAGYLFGRIRRLGNPKFRSLNR